MEWKSIQAELATVLLSAAGGFAKYLHDYMLGEPFVMTKLIASTLVSGFSGYMFAQLGATFNVSEKMLFVFAGVGGFMGASTLEVIRLWLLGRFNLEKKVENTLGKRRKK